MDSGISIKDIQEFMRQHGHDMEDVAEIRFYIEGYALFKAVRSPEGNRLVHENEFVKEWEHHSYRREG